MFNNINHSIPTLNDDPFGLNLPINLDLPIPELWDISEIAFPAIHEAAESLTKRNANDDQEASDSLPKRFRPAPPSHELKVIDEVAQPVILNNEASTMGYTQEQEAMIVTRIQQRQNFRTIAEELFIDYDELNQNWYQFLRLKYPHVNYDPISSERTSIFTGAEDKEIARRIEAGDTYQDIAKALNKKSAQVNGRWLNTLQYKYPQTVYKHAHKRKAESIPLPIKPFPDNYEQVQKGVYLATGAPPTSVDEKPFYLTLPDLDPLEPTSLRVDAIAQPVVNKKFLRAEDLRIVLDIIDGKNYPKIGEALNKKPDQISQRWNNYLKLNYPGIRYNPLSPAEKAHPFTEAETQRIQQGKEANETNVKIAEALYLTPAQIGYWWNQHLSKNYPELAQQPIEDVLPFTRKQDETLITGIKRRLNWNNLSQILKRPSKHLEDHWYNDLSKSHPGIEYNPEDPRSTSIFNVKTDTDIVRLIKARFFYEEIAKELGYDKDQIRHRWNRKLKKEYPNVSYQPVPLEFRSKPSPSTQPKMSLLSILN